MTAFLRSFPRCLALVLLALPGLGHAFTACVGTAQELNDAMGQIYTTTDATTTIQIRTGTYQAGNTKAFYAYPAHSNQTISITGGWDTGCQNRRYGAEGGTILVGDVSAKALIVDFVFSGPGNTVNVTDLTLKNPTGIDNNTGTCLIAGANAGNTLRVYRILAQQCQGTKAVALENYGGNLTFANSVVRGNFTSNAPVTLEAFTGGITQLAQLTITGNTNTSASPNASGLWLYAKATPQSQVSLINSVVWGGITSAGVPDIATDGPGITFTRVHYDTRDSLNAAITDNSPSSGNPGFLSPGNARLRRASLLIDSGVATFVGGTVDADGNTRLQGAANDVGAYETNPDRLFADGLDH